MIAKLSLVVSFALLVILYHLFGNTAFLETSSQSIFVWLFMAWTLESPGMMDASHGPLVVIFSLAIVWMKRKNVEVAAKGVWPPALAIMTCGLLLHWCGFRTQQIIVSLISLIALLWSIPSFIYGYGVCRILLFPCAYLVFAIPWNFLTSFSFQLRLIASSLSHVLLNGLGLPIERVGTAIFVGGASGLALDVADPCSGIKSLAAMCALAGGYAYFLPANWWKKTLLFLASIPIAVLSNVARVMIIAIAARFSSQELALRFYHDFSGYFVFIAAVLMMMAVGSLLKAGTPSKHNSPRTETK